jgi:integrase
MLRTRQSTLVANQNLSLLKGFADWAIEQGLMESNPFTVIARLKGSKAVNPKRTPLTLAQTRSFLDAIKFDRYYSGYHDFCMALFYLGVRPSEAAGLRWRHIDWQRRVVTICESLSRGEQGQTADYARQRKSTKTNKACEIELHEHIYAMLQGCFNPDVDNDALIFTTSTRLPIDDHTFSQRVWRRICKRIGIERVPYAARHSLGSHMLEASATIPQVAAVLGNTPKTTARYYSHMVNRPKMPGF